MKEVVNPASAGGLGEDRISRYAKVDLSGIAVRKAVAEEGIALVRRMCKGRFSCKLPNMIGESPMS